MAPPPKARAKRGNASRYCCGSGHVQRQGGSPLKANVSTAKHRSASAAVAVSISASAMIPYVHLYATVFGSLTAQFFAQIRRAEQHHSFATCIRSTARCQIQPICLLIPLGNKLNARFG